MSQNHVQNDTGSFSTKVPMVPNGGLDPGKPADFGDLGNRENHLFPVFFDLKNKPCLVVGAGSVGASKIRSLLQAGARVTVVAPQACETVETWARAGRLRWLDRFFRERDLDGQFLAIAATDDQSLNRNVFRLAETRLMPVNAVDDEAACNFVLGAVATSGPVKVAVSTAGASPTLAGRLRDAIRDTQLDHATGVLADYLGTWRKRTGSCLSGMDQKRRFWRTVLESVVPKCVRAGRIEMADREMERLLALFGTAPATPLKPPRTPRSKEFHYV